MNIGKLDYDGSLIHDRFGYKFFRDNYNPLGNLVAFRGKMIVTDNLIDLEDKLNNDFIYSDDAVNFCWELPGVCAFGGVAFQRLFCTYVANVLRNILGDSVTITMSGDDIMVMVGENQYQKASVSISTLKNGAVLGHLGINVVAGDRAPRFAYSTNLTDEQVDMLINAVQNVFHEMTKSIFVATTKTV